MRLAALVVLVFGCANHHKGSAVVVDSEVTPTTDACTAGLTCFQVDCAQQGLPPTTISGTVYAPNGTLPLYGVNVYVPFNDPGALPVGVSCDKCSDGLPGGIIVATKTDEAGHFVLTNVPATANVPLVVQTGKWRRQLVLPSVAACQEEPLLAVETTLPKSRSDATPLTAMDPNGQPKVDLPFIAVTTGAFDALECLVLKLGIDPTEITNGAGGGHVQLFANSGAVAGRGEGASQFASTWPGGAGQAFGEAQTLWSTKANLSKYDVVMFSCEGGQYQASKPQSAMQAVHDYAAVGGRVFMSHWHNIWIGGQGGAPAHGLADWEALATFNYNAAEDQDATIASIDETSHAKGPSFATWLDNVGASTVHDQVPINGARYTLASNDATKSERWAFIDPTLAATAGHVSVQDLQFTTPVDVMPEQRCGKVVFSDMHVASGSTSSSAVPYPGGCALDANLQLAPLSPQEKALAFIFFDIASCVGPLQ